MLSNLWRHRSLIGQLVRPDVLLKYRDSYLFPGEILPVMLVLSDQCACTYQPLPAHSGTGLLRTLHPFAAAGLPVRARHRLAPGSGRCS